MNCRLRYMLDKWRRTGHRRGRWHSQSLASNHPCRPGRRRKVLRCKFQSSSPRPKHTRVLSYVPAHRRRQSTSPNCIPTRGCTQGSPPVRRMAQPRHSDPRRNGSSNSRRFRRRSCRAANRRRNPKDTDPRSSPDRSHSRVQTSAKKSRPPTCLHSIQRYTVARPAPTRLRPGRSTRSRHQDSHRRRPPVRKAVRPHRTRPGGVCSGRNSTPPMCGPVCSRERRRTPRDKCERRQHPSRREQGFRSPRRSIRNRRVPRPFPRCPRSRRRCRQHPLQRCRHPVRYRRRVRTGTGAAGRPRRTSNSHRRRSRTRKARPCPACIRLEPDSNTQERRRSQGRPRTRRHDL